VALLIDHQSINVPVGSRDFGPVTIPDGLAQVTLRLARMTTATPTLWAAGVSVDLKSWCSLDGGATWLQWLGFGSSGGIHVKRDSTEALESTVTSMLPTGANRRMKLTATVTGGTLVSQLTVEVA
jgi:hypothetical protein